MNAIILAAGVARRLYPLTFDMPKCLVEVRNKPIINYQLEALRSQGIHDVIVVVGYFRERLISHLRRDFEHVHFTFVTNEHFFETNTAYSLYLCGKLLSRTDNVLMNGDVLYPAELLKRVMNSPHKNVMAVEVKRCGREEVKVVSGADGRVVAIGKELIQENALGEFIGVAKFSQDFNGRFVDSLEHLIQAGGKADYFEAAIHPLLGRCNMYYEDVSDLPCIEIDFAEDLTRAENLVRSDWFNNQI